MSSTNRGYDRHESDYYVTPINEIKNFFNQFLIDEKIERPDRLMYMDPCAGGKTNSAQNKMPYPHVIESLLGGACATIDKREDSLAEIKGDYLNFDIGQDQYDVIITNPPFYIAEQILEKALKDVSAGGYVILLLRLNFFGSRSRKPLFEKQMPKRCYVHHKRINFITKEQNQDRVNAGLKKLTGDSIEYAHFVWQKGCFPQECLTTVI